ncbi:hypothetical protein DPMN_068460 [Dreissena polymorpha]|uniref:Uncharacterized protein n=2 Tax=Dreissena polymorpha TaxID=45954 RepID=A0A9D3Z1P6_DREPO|nr:hypothetical protein DPMN_068460 [Dreissena polymorpha]
MFTVIEATVEDTHSLESVQESEPLMIQHASVDCADHMQSTGFTLVLSESMSTAASEGPASLTHDEMRAAKSSRYELNLKTGFSAFSIIM